MNLNRLFGLKHFLLQFIVPGKYIFSKGEKIMNKKIIFTAVVLMIMSVNVSAKGGAGPCLATCLLGDTRLGLAMNQGEQIETIDWINLASNFIPFVGPVLKLYVAYEAGYKPSGATGCCVAYIWGPRPGRMFTDYKLRTKEILLCIPVVNIYPIIALPCEAYNGKTLTEVIQEENLKR
jgi:hypothetical protein